MRSRLLAATLSFFFLSIQSLSHADLIVPPPAAAPGEARPTAVRFRIINRSPHPVYLQGYHQDQDHLILNFFYREAQGGWKPFLDYLPCDSPSCREIGRLPKSCPKGTMIPILVGAAGGENAMFEYLWEGRLFDRTEAMLEHHRGQYCYRPIIPATGTLRVEVEYSQSFWDTPVKPGEPSYPGRIGPREKSVIEFQLPPVQPMMELFLFAPPSEGESHKFEPRRP